MRTSWVLIVVASTGLATVARAADAVEGEAKAALTVMKTGPRSGSAGSKYFNVQGKANGEDARYASFGVLEFRLPKPAGAVESVSKLTLTLTQSPARFSKDGKLNVELTTDATTALTEETPLKFDTAVSGGVGGQLAKRHPLGTATFKKGEKGQADAVTLEPKGEAEAFLRQRLTAGEPVRLVLTPADVDVAATYSGAGEGTDGAPKLRAEFGPGKP